MRPFLTDQINPISVFFLSGPQTFLLNSFSQALLHCVFSLFLVLPFFFINSGNIKKCIGHSLLRFCFCEYIRESLTQHVSISNLLPPLNLDKFWCIYPYVMVILQLYLGPTSIRNSIELLFLVLVQISL